MSTRTEHLDPLCSDPGCSVRVLGASSVRCVRGVLGVRGGGRGRGSDIGTIPWCRCGSCCPWCPWFSVPVVGRVAHGIVVSVVSVVSESVMCEVSVVYVVFVVSMMWMVCPVSVLRQCQRCM
jgi:hypothetical protein